MPRSLVEAARIDGATEFEIYYKIALPILKPALGTLGIITFLTSWNDFMRALVVMTEKVNYTVPVALNTMKGMQTIDYGAIMIGATISILPLVIIFIFLSRWIITRLTEGAIKG
jgi:multiple sugar transport system permease protein